MVAGHGVEAATDIWSGRFDHAVSTGSAGSNYCAVRAVAARTLVRVTGAGALVFTGQTEALIIVVAMLDDSSNRLGCGGWRQWCVGTTWLG